MLVGGIATTAAPGAIGLISADDAASWYWGFAGPGIALACALFYATRRIQMPARFGPTSASVALAMVVGAPVIAVVSGSAGAPGLVVASGLAAFAVLYGSALVGFVSAAHGVAAGATIVSDSATVADAATITAGLVSCVCGIIGVPLLDAVSPPGR